MRTNSVVHKSAKPFEVPAYLLEAVSSINDGAKSAQAGVLAFTLVEFYLLAISFSTTDLDFLLDRTMQISQIGVQMPVVFSFAIAPVIFLLLHLYTLIRFDLLGSNLERFRSDLSEMLPEPLGQERCRQLLANVEFVQANATPVSSPSYSRVFGWISWSMMAALPTAVFLVLQGSTLRYQSDGITWTQRLCFFVDLAALVWFYQRKDKRLQGSGGIKRLAVYASFPLALAILNLLYFNVPDATADEKMIHYDWRSYATGNGKSFKSTLPEKTFWARIAEALSQPLDTVTCPSPIHWGCRYLSVEHQTVLGQVWDPQSIISMASGSMDVKSGLYGMEGVYLRGRTLRFALLNSSRLYNANFIDADLRHAQLSQGQLQGADFYRANLQGVSFYQAHLQGAHLYEANISGGDLDEAHLEAADLSDTDMQGASLDQVQAQGADFANSRMERAQLSSANLSGAYMYGARLDGAIITKNCDFSLADLRNVSIAGVKQRFDADGKTKPSGKPSMEFAASQGAAMVDEGSVIAKLASKNTVTFEEKDYRGALSEYLAGTLAPEAPGYADGIATWLISEEYGADNDDEAEFVAVSCALLDGAQAKKFSLGLDSQDGLRAITENLCKPA